jgi:hypothetical protein
VAADNHTVMHSIVTADQAASEVLAAGWIPDEPYPGALDKAWAVRCAVCTSPARHPLRRIRAVPRCQPCATGTTPAQVKALAHEHGYTASEPYPGHQAKPWELRCNDCGTVEPRTLTGLRRYGKTCKTCRDRAAVAELAQHGGEPLEPYPGQQSKGWKIRCTRCGWVPPNGRSLNRIRQGFRCRGCIGWLVDPAERERIVRAAGFIPTAPPPRLAGDPWPCRCSDCGYVVPVIVANIKKGHGCRHCSGRRTMEEAVAEMLERGFRPRVDYPGAAHKPWESECLRCGEIVRPRLANLRVRPDLPGCGRCSGRATITPVLAAQRMEARGCTPQEPFPGRSRPWSLKCHRCKEVTPRTYKAVMRGHGCRRCDKQGFDYAGPAYVYLITSRLWDAGKIGIYGKRAQKDRIKIMRPHGWQLFRELPCASGTDARAIEQAVCANSERS